MPKQRPPPPNEPEQLVKHIPCPRCASPKAVIAATHFSTLLCFCPACEHAWDCEDETG